MGDLQSPAIFAEIFEALAGEKPIDPDYFWDLTSQYDFCPEDMCCDDALIKLGLAEKSQYGTRYKGDSDFRGPIT